MDGSRLALTTITLLAGVGFVSRRRRDGSLAGSSRDQSFQSITKRRAHELLRNPRVIASGEIEFETVPGLTEPWSWSIIEGIVPGSDARFVKVVVGDEDLPLGVLLWSFVEQGFVSAWVDADVRGRGLGTTMVDLFRRNTQHPVHFVGPYSASGLRLAGRYSHEEPA